MKIAFYAPLKPVSSPSPSGDRLIGRLFKKALEVAGHTVVIASELRSYEGNGDPSKQAELKLRASNEAAGLIQEFRSDPPDIWFTYHLYRKAPDWLGPTVCRQLDIPYCVAEASVAPSQAQGKWKDGYQAVLDALSRAQLVIGTTKADEACVLPALGPDARYIRMKPFLDTTAFDGAPQKRDSARLHFSSGLEIDRTPPWLLTVAMMRPGVKLQSYDVLAKALRLCLDIPWRLLVAGDGPCREDVHAMFSGMEDRIVWLGETSAEDVALLYAASDLYVWPSVRESPGMTFLEAQASGLPVIGGDGGGVPDVIQNGRGGFLVPKLDVDAFSQAVRQLLEDARLRDKMGHDALAYVEQNHTLQAAADPLNRELVSLVK